RTIRRRGMLMSASFDDLELDRTVLERLLADGVTFSPRFELRSFDGVRLEEAIQLSLFAPPALKGVVADGPAGRVNHGRVLPAGQLHEQPGDLAAEEPRGALGWCSQAEPGAGGRHRGRVMHAGLDLHDMRHSFLLLRRSG